MTKEEFIQLLESAWDHVNNCIEEGAVCQVADMAFGGLVRGYGDHDIMDKLALLAAAEAKLMEMADKEAEEEDLEDDDVDCENCPDKDTCEQSTAKSSTQSNPSDKDKILN
jgi:hypothetical protein